MKAVFVLLAALEAVKLADAKEKVETSFEVDAALEHLQNLWQEADGTVSNDNDQVFEQLEEPLIAHHPHVHLHQPLQKVDLV